MPTLQEAILNIKNEDLRTMWSSEIKSLLGYDTWFQLKQHLPDTYAEKEAEARTWRTYR